MLRHSKKSRTAHQNTIKSLPTVVRNTILGFCQTVDIRFWRMTCRAFKGDQASFPRVFFTSGIMKDRYLYEPGFVRKVYVNGDEWNRDLTGIDWITSRFYNVEEIGFEQTMGMSVLFDYLERLSKLRKLDLSGVYFKSWKGDITRLGSLANLHTLKLPSVSHAAQRVLFDTATLVNLRDLHLWDASETTDAGFSSLAQLVNLEKISFSQASRLTDDGLKFAAHLHRLRIFEMFDCEHVTGAGFNFLS